MGNRKRNTADARKEAKRVQYFAKLNNCQMSPRKMRLIADMIRGKSVDHALGILQYAPQEAARYMHKLLLSAVSNWQQKNEGVRVEDAALYVKTVMVDEGRTQKRMRPRAKGMGHRIMKRSNHVTLFVDSAAKVEDESLVEKPEVDNK